MTATWPHAHSNECVCINDLRLAQRDLLDVFQKVLSMIQQLNASLNIHAPQHMLQKNLYGNADGLLMNDPRKPIKIKILCHWT